MRKFKVVITDYTYEDLDVERKILAQRDDIEVLDYQDRTEEGVMGFSGDCDVLVCQYAAITRRVIENLKNCKMIIRYAIGVDNIDLEAAGERGIPVVNVPDYGIDEVSTHAVAMILASMRKLPQTLKDVRDRKWNYARIKPLYRTQGSTLGLVGLGRIPCAVVKKMSGFGMKILSYDPYAPEERASELGVELVGLDRLLEESDCVSIHCPLTEQTRHMFNMETFRKMKPTAFLVNTARGGIVDGADLAKACREGVIAGAAVDVVEREPIAADDPLLELDNVMVTPHLAWYTEEAIVSLKEKLASEIIRVHDGEDPINIVNRAMLKKQ